MRRFLATLGAAAVLAGIAAPVAAQDYPTRPIEVVVGYSAGGGSDVMARTVASYLEPALGGASVVVRNLPGAGGQIGFTEVATAEADGYTLGVMNLPAAVALTYDRDADYTVDSFTWLGNFVYDPNTLVVPASSGIESLEDLVAKAKENPGAITAGLTSLGGNDHFAAIQFANAAGIELTQVPFKGASMARAAMLGGHVAMGTMAYSQTVGFEDELKVLAVLSDERLPYAPDVPTARELGFDITMGSYRGIVGPANLPDDVRQKLIDALGAVAKDPKFTAAMEEQGSPVEFSEGEAYEALAKEQNEAAAEIWKTTPWK
ncbi:tripartite tricarboxylate transporter substrate binding protein [Jiella avicenniae]|uniref:Tripartite tricarboxylate transporter substrate binding protein n=1 Tax=Jiella avicenniae TaxID=2907202 RepID=A0A9X1P4C4_9HYPH|nr:tripartite tricarboxylate transporter substrate binding protein [Jiella avicenniae]MCE7029624.1 tripartite tricarboxylate transporter substrate binding protein [Jiella avicenniae]